VHFLKAVAFGAEAQLYTVEEKAEDHGWVLAEYFNCSQHPSNIKGDYILKMNGRFTKLNIPGGADAKI
jgi:hypothetical protein